VTDLNKAGGMCSPLPAYFDKEFLTAQLDNCRSGLVVDGKCGDAEMIFPWAVWEAKRRARGLYDGQEAGVPRGENVPRDV
jgi:hypothetical protein